MLTNDEVDKIVARMTNAQDMRRTYGRVARRMKRLLIDEARDRGGMAIRTGKNSVILKAMMGRRFDMDRFKREEFPAYEEYCKPVTAYRIEVI